MFPSACGYNTVFPDEFVHYYSEPAIHQEPIVTCRYHHTSFHGTSPDKNHSVSFYGTVSQAGVRRDENDFMNASTADIDKPVKTSIELPESVKVSKAKPVSISLAEENLLSINLYIKNEITINYSLFRKRPISKKAA